MIDDSCRDWSKPGREIIETIWDILVPKGAYDQRKEYEDKKHFRVFLKGKENPVVQLEDRARSGKVWVKLTVGEDSPLIGDGKPLKRSKSGQNQKERERGENTFGMSDVADLRKYIEDAFYFCHTGKVAVASSSPPPPPPPLPIPPAIGSDEADDDHDDDLDHRKSVDRQIKVRRRQKKFREALRKRFEDSCAITGCSIVDVLEAAHIKPYLAGERDNAPDNGLLLRGDIHTLFDLDLIGINPDSLKVELHPSLVGSKEYGPLKGDPIAQKNGKPRTSALRQRYDQFLIACKRKPRRITG
jgi:hypothetical protein